MSLSRFGVSARTRPLGALDLERIPGWPPVAMGIWARENQTPRLLGVPGQIKMISRVFWAELCPPPHPKFTGWSPNP